MKTQSSRSQTPTAANTRSLSSPPRQPALRRLWLAGALVVVLANFPVQAADHTVTSLADSGPGTLRAALGIASPGDTIIFDAGLTWPGQITLESELLVNRSVTILGPGPDKLTIHGQNTHRGLSINGSPVVISGLKIQNCKATGTFATGAGIKWAGGSLTLTNCHFVNNVADGTYAYGGACYSEVSGSLIVESCWFAANQAVGDASSGSGYGGAVYLGGNLGSLFAVRNSTLSANEAKGSQALGGGICLEIQIPISLVNSTLSDNSAVRTGGSPPSAFARGGAFYSLCGVFSGGLTNCTVANNSATDTEGGLAAEYVFGGNSLWMQNSLIASNTAPVSPNLKAFSDFSEPLFVSLGNNLIGIAPGDLIAGPNDQFGTSGSPIDPLIGILFNNGGPTPTRALLPGSPAINTANPAAAPPTDQRGLSRVGDPDIGAYELQTGLPLSITCPTPFIRSAAIFPNPEVATLTHADLGTPTIPCSCQELLVVKFDTDPDGAGPINVGDLVPNPYAFPLGPTTVRWEATDTDPDPDETASCTQTITVNPGVNSNPVFDSGPATPLQGYKDHLFTAPAAFAFIDPDPGQVVTYSASGLPAGVSIDLNTGLISGTPTTAGTYNVIVTATDNFPGTPGTASTASFQFKVDDFVTLTVNPTPANGRITASSTLFSPALNCGTGGAVCSQEYPLTVSPIIATLTAVPDPDYALDSWGGDADPDLLTATVPMSGNKTVTATFVPLRTLNLTVTGSPGIVGSDTLANGGLGSWDNAGECSKLHTPQFRHGQTVRLTRVLQAGASWSGWTVGTDPTLITTDFIDVAMTEDRTVTATFTPTATRIQFGALPATTPVLAGEPVNRGFTVTTPGLTGGTIAYQWFKEAGAIDVEFAGQNTATLTITPISATDEGQYYLRVVNQCGETADSPFWTLSLQRDFGDAPHSTPASQFPTLLVNDGARHILWAAIHANHLRLGAQVDAEANGQPNVSATGDDTIGVPDDEDGVTFNPIYLALSRSSSAIVNANKAGKLDAWIDFNGDGVWLDADNERITIAAGRSLNVGNNTVPYTVPVTAGPGQRIARFRISSAGGLSPTGDAPVGEVEDHLVNIKQSPIVGLPPVITLPVNAAHSAVYLPLTVDGGWAVITPISTTPASPAIFLDPPFYIAPAFPNPGYLRLAPAGGQFGFATVLFQVNSGATFTHPLAVRIRNAPDTDEIPAAVEDNIPLPGGGTTNDGNGDGTPDSQQLYVASLPASEGTYLTLSGPATIRLTDVSIVPPSGSLPGEFPFGLLKFNVEGVAPGGSVQLILKIHGTIPPGAEYYKLGKATRGDTADSYFEFNFLPPDSLTGAVLNSPSANEITLYLTDGALGDSDWTANGVIVDPGGPMLLAAPAPTLSITPLPGNQAQISWPLADNGAALKYTPSLVAPITWENDTNTVTTNGLTKSVTVDISPGTRFYRLMPP